MKKMNNKFFMMICFLVLFLSFVTPSNTFAQQILYGASASDCDDFNLYTVDPTTGAATVVGSMGVDGISALSFDPITGTLYAATGGISTGGDGCLYTVNTTTGAATLVGCGSLSSGSDTITDMDFRSDGTLFGYYKPGNELATINKATGVPTPVGITGLCCQGNGMDFGPGDVLYHANEDGLSTLNPVTGVGTFIGALNYVGFPPLSNPRINALSFDQNGVLYGIVNDSSGRFLATINTATLDVTNIGGTTNECLDALAWSLLVLPPPVSVPALSEFGIVILMLLTLTPAIWMLRKRRLA